MINKLECRIESLAKMLALFGGIILLAIIILTSVSIIGRSFIFWGLSPILGDFELVEASIALAIFCFLPWTQLTKAHATVDIFTDLLPRSIQFWINFIVEVIMAVAIIIITWKLFDGTISKAKYDETTLILQFPVWWAYAASLVASCIGCVVATYMIYIRFIELKMGKLKTNGISGELH